MKTILRLSTLSFIIFLLYSVTSCTKGESGETNVHGIVYSASDNKPLDKIPVQLKYESRKLFRRSDGTKKTVFTDHRGWYAFSFDAEEDKDYWVAISGAEPDTDIYQSVTVFLRVAGTNYVNAGLTEYSQVKMIFKNTPPLDTAYYIKTSLWNSPKLNVHSNFEETSRIASDREYKVFYEIGKQNDTIKNVFYISAKVGETVSHTIEY